MASDIERLQGAWHITALESDGQRMNEVAFAGASIVVEGSGFKSLGMGGTYEGVFELDLGKNPKHLDLLFTRGHAAGTRHPAIYKLEDDCWTICMAINGGQRPRKFATKPESGYVLETLERRAAGQAKRASASRAAASARGAKRSAHAAESGPVTEWDGEWSMAAGVFNGEAMNNEMLRWCTRITSSGVTTVAAGPQTMLKASFTLDGSAIPHAVDYVNLQGPHKGKAQAGIYERDGDTLRICMAPPGKPRPADFASKRGDGRSFTTWRLK